MHFSTAFMLHEFAAILPKCSTCSCNLRLEKNIGATEACFRAAFPECEIRRAFTSEGIIEKLAEKSGLQVDSLWQALEKIAADGVSEVYLQPLYLTQDKTYAWIREAVARISRAKEKGIKKVVVGRPLLASVGFKEHPDDYRIAIEALRSDLPEVGGEKALVFMCNGTQQMEYSVLQLKLADAGIRNVFIYTAEGYPSFARVLQQLKECAAVEEVILAPFIFAASEHVFSYLGADAADSAKSRLEAEGYRVLLHKKGLGENPAIREVFVQHLQDALRARAAKHGACQNLPVMRKEESDAAISQHVKL